MEKRFCFIKVIRNKLRRKYKITIIIVFVVSLLLLFLFKTNEIIEPRLLAISKQKTNDALKALSHKVLSNIKFDDSNLMEYKTDNEGNIVAVEYDTKELNQMLDESLKVIKSSLKAASEGEEDPLLKEVFFEDGIIYEVPIGYLTGIAFLQNEGYRLKIELPLFHYVSGNLKIDSKSYGINSSLITINLELKIEAEVITTIYAQKIKFSEKIPLVIQIVQGDVPSFTTQEKKSSY